jgi:hypothetical protein
MEKRIRGKNNVAGGYCLKKSGIMAPAKEYPQAIR